MGRVSGNYRVGPTVLARLMETQKCCLPSGSVGEGLRIGTMVSVTTSVWEKTAMATFTLVADNSVTSYKSPGAFLATVSMMELREMKSE